METAAHILRTACHSHSDGVADLLPSAGFLASHCTPALLSSLLSACDATTPVAGAPKKLTMLNAAWKLLLAVASYKAVAPQDYEAVLLHMIEQLRWGVLTHDWSDKKRVRLATFFASHLVLAVRAHPQLLLSGTEAAQVFLAHLVRLHFAVCVTVATSTRDDEMLATLYSNIVVRLHGIFDCLGGAAAVTPPAVVTASATAVEEGRAEEAAAVAGGGHDEKEREAGEEDLRESPAAVEELLLHCVSVAAAAEVQEAAGGGERVLQATATAGLSAYLHVLQGLLKKLSEGGEAATPAAAAAKEEEEAPPAAATSVKAASGDLATENTEGEDTGSEDGAGAAAAGSCSTTPAMSTKTLSVLTDSLLLWTRHRSIQHEGTNDGVEETPAAGEARGSYTAAEAAIKKGVQTLAAALPPDIFAPPPFTENPRVRADGPFPSAVAAPVSLRGMWVGALASVWQQWVALCASADEVESSGRGDGEDACTSSQDHTKPHVKVDSQSSGVPRQTSTSASLSAHFSSVVLSAVTCTRHTSAVALMALEAWAKLFRRVNSAAAAGPSPPSSQSTQAATVRVLLRVLANLRCAAAHLARHLLRLRQVERCSSEHGAGCGECLANVAALLVEWICAVVALCSYGETALDVPLLCPLTDGAARSDDDHDGAEEEEEHEKSAADALVCQIAGIMRSHSTTSFSPMRREYSEGDAAGLKSQGGWGELGPSRAAAELRAALTSLQQTSRQTWRQSTPSAGQLCALCQLLIKVPCKLHDLIDAYAAPALSSSSPPLSLLPHAAVADERRAETYAQLKRSVVACVSLLASLTQTLQSMAEAPADVADDEGSVEDSTEAKERHGHYSSSSNNNNTATAAVQQHQQRWWWWCSARVARWVASRLLYEIAVVPVTDGADDAVLLACVRRWTDIAFSATSPPSTLSCSPHAMSATTTATAQTVENVKMAQRCGDTVVHADAAASLLRVAEECTTLGLESLNLSEAATTALMTLIEGDKEGDHGGSSSSSSSNDSAARWCALQEEEARQETVTQAWFKRQAEAALLEGVQGERSASRVVPESSATDLSFTAANDFPTTAVEYVRCLQLCETVLRRLYESITPGAFEMSDNVKAHKRRRVEPRCGDAGLREQEALQVNEEEHACVVRSLVQIQQLCHSTLMQLEGNTAADCIAPPAFSPLSRSVAIKDQLLTAHPTAELRRETQVFTLSDAESVGSHRKPSSAEVIDIE